MMGLEMSVLGELVPKVMSIRSSIDVECKPRVIARFRLYVLMEEYQSGAKESGAFPERCTVAYRTNIELHDKSPPTENPATYF